MGQCVCYDPGMVGSIPSLVLFFVSVTVPLGEMIARQAIEFRARHATLHLPHDLFAAVVYEWLSVLVPLMVWVGVFLSVRKGVPKEIIKMFRQKNGVDRLC